jgi:hypothetical protein
LGGVFVSQLAQEPIQPSVIGTIGYRHQLGVRIASDGWGWGHVLQLAA